MKIIRKMVETGCQQLFVAPSLVASLWPTTQTRHGQGRLSTDCQQAIGQLTNAGCLFQPPYVQVELTGNQGMGCHFCACRSQASPATKPIRHDLDAAATTAATAKPGVPAAAAGRAVASTLAQWEAVGPSTNLDVGTNIPQHGWHASSATGPTWTGSIASSGVRL